MDAQENEDLTLFIGGAEEEICSQTLALRRRGQELYFLSGQAHL